MSFTDDDYFEDDLDFIPKQKDEESNDNDDGIDILELIG